MSDVIIDVIVGDHTPEVIEVFTWPGPPPGRGAEIPPGTYVTATGGGQETVATHGNTGPTETIDLTAGNVHVATQDQTCTYTFTGATASKACSFTLILTSVTGAATWPASVDWADGTAPTLTGLSVLTFLTTNAGTTWLGFPAGKAFT